MKGNFRLATGVLGQGRQNFDPREWERKVIDGTSGRPSSSGRLTTSVGIVPWAAVVSVASCERSFCKLKLNKNYLRSTMSDARLTNLGILSIERELADEIDFDDVISEFSVRKARKICL